MRTVKLITLELRPRLQTCNVFICLKETVNLDDVKIKLLEGSIVLNIEGNDINFQLESVKLIPTSLSALSIKNEWICFHVQTKSEKSFGSFNAEIISSQNQRTPFLDENSKSNDPLKGSTCNISCKCCKNLVSKPVHFERVLPYPDLDYMADWFCHSHGNALPNVSPRETDLFYGSSFSILNRNLFSKDLRVNKDAIVCGRCLSCLGKPNSYEESYKLWNCCVSFISVAGKMIKPATEALPDFLLVIKSSLNGILGEELVLQSLVGNEAHYLFVKPINQQLTLMTEAEEDCNDNVIHLERITVMKVLYRYGTEPNKVSVCNDNTKHCDVALPVIEAGFKHLLSTTRRFPQIHRVAAGYYIGHVPLGLN